MSSAIERITGFIANDLAVIGVNSGVFTKGDFVYIDANGFLATALAGGLIWGVVMETVTMAADNQTVAKYTPKVLNWRNVSVRITTEGAVALVQSDVGEYADLVTVTSGGMTMAAAPGTTSGQLVVKNFDPDINGNTFVAIVTVAEGQDVVGASQAI